MQEDLFYVYMMTNKQNGTFYVGMTSNLLKRAWQHKNKIIKSFTEQYSIDKLVYYESTSDFWAAYERERQLKKWRRTWKLELIESFNPEWKDLYNLIAF